MLEHRPNQNAQPYNPHINTQTTAQHQEQLNDWEHEGGAIQDRTQMSEHQQETQLKTTTCPVAEQPISYTEEAQHMKELNTQFDECQKLVEKKVDRNDEKAHEKCEQIKKLETEAQRAANLLDAEQESHRKEQCKLQSEFEKQQLKTVKMAEELSQTRAEQQRVEAEHAREMLDKDGEARRLAEQLAEKRAKDREYVQQQVQELDEAERALLEKIRRLADNQNKEVAEMELKQQEMNTSVEVSRKSMEELRRHHEKERHDLETLQTRLGMVRAQAFAAHQLTEEQTKERETLLMRVFEVENKLDEQLRCADQLNMQKAQLEQEILNKQQDVRLNESALTTQEQLVAKVQEERRTVECHANEQLKNEELALQRAQELSKKVCEERHDLQKDLERLSEEEKHVERLIAGGRLNEEGVEQRVGKDNFQQELEKTEMVQEAECTSCETRDHPEEQWKPSTEGKTLTEKIVDTIADKLF